MNDPLSLHYYFWWLHQMSLLDTMSITCAKHIEIEEQRRVICISRTTGDKAILTWHGVSGHEQ